MSLSSARIAASALVALAVATLAAPAHAGEPRRYGDLLVEDPPRAPTQDGLDRRFPDFEGSLVVGEPRVWVGRPVPSAVSLGFDGLELWALAPTDGGDLALYAEPFAASMGSTGPGCSRASMWTNCRYAIRMYRASGELAWEVSPNAFFQRADHLRIDRAASDGKTLYYAEACQTYAADAKGKCSQVVAVDVTGPTPKVRWRSPFKASNADIVLVPGGRWLVTGYGFTAERDALHVIDRETGAIVARASVPKAPERITLAPDGRLSVRVYGQEEPRVFQLIDGKKPRLVPAR